MPRTGPTRFSVCLSVCRLGPCKKPAEGSGTCRDAACERPGRERTSLDDGSGHETPDWTRDSAYETAYDVRTTHRRTPLSEQQRGVQSRAALPCGGGSSLQVSHLFFRVRSRSGPSRMFSLSWLARCIAALAGSGGLYPHGSLVEPPVLRRKSSTSPGHSSPRQCHIRCAGVLANIPRVKDCNIHSSTVAIRHCRRIRPGRGHRAGRLGRPRCLSVHTCPRRLPRL